jgi:hypothetical protein
MPDLIVIGAGLSGLALARAAARRGGGVLGRADDGGQLVEVPDDGRELGPGRGVPDGVGHLVDRGPAIAGVEAGGDAQPLGRPGRPTVDHDGAAGGQPGCERGVAMHDGDLGCRGDHHRPLRCLVEHLDVGHRGGGERPDEQIGVGGLGECGACRRSVLQSPVAEEEGDRHDPQGRMVLPRGRHATGGVGDDERGHGG